MDQVPFIEKLRELPAEDPFVVKWGDLVTIYGRMWRRWPASDGREIDQLAWVIEGLKEKPFRKSYVVSAWNPDFIYAMASKGNVNEVPPFCHTIVLSKHTNKPFAFKCNIIYNELKITEKERTKEESEQITEDIIPEG